MLNLAQAQAEAGKENGPRQIAHLFAAVNINNKWLLCPEQAHKYPPEPTHGFRDPGRVGSPLISGPGKCATINICLSSGNFSRT